MVICYGSPRKLTLVIKEKIDKLGIIQIKIFLLIKRHYLENE